MADIDKVITHFKDAIEASGDGNKWRFVRVDIIEDAIELLKEREPVFVGCSDCKHYGYHDMTNQDGFCYCMKRHEYLSPDFFCADWEGGGNN